jgi:hypothetical protein
MKLTIDDFEWVERGFDTYYLMHKVYELAIAKITNFSGWTLQVSRVSTHHDPLISNGLDLEATKMVAMVHVNEKMREYENALNLRIKYGSVRERSENSGPQAVRAGVFRMD